MTIVVAVPNVVAGRRLVAVAADYARRGETDVLLLHHERLRDTDAGVDQEVRDVRQARADVHALADQVREGGIQCRVAVVTSQQEDPADALLQRAEDEDAELLVVGIRSRSRVGKLLLGSTAQDLLLGATCHVLAVKVDRQLPERPAEPRQGAATP